MDPAPIAKLRSELAGQVKRPLEVSEKSTQYWFDEESAAYNDIDIKLGGALFEGAPDFNSIRRLADETAFAASRTTRALALGRLPAA